MIELPTRSGSYRWLYVDFTAGECSAVAIFMLGNIFSPGYSAGASRGVKPCQHSAVNFALYDHGARKQWALTEYPNAQLSPSKKTLQIGRSTWTYGANVAEVRVSEIAAPWGGATEAVLEFELDGEPGPEVQLVPGLPHWWRPIAPRARARLCVPSLGLDVAGLAYHDGNHGEEQLGGTLRGWRWARTHGTEETRIRYEPPGAPAIEVTARGGAISVVRQDAAVPPLRRSGWGLELPGDYQGARPRLLESSPFYARLEAEREGDHTLGEVADFRRFHHPFVRWMANFRMRSEARS